MGAGASHLMLFEGEPR